MGISTQTHTSGACREITPSDSVDLGLGVCRAIYVGGGGSVSIVDATGVTTVFSGVASGSILPIQAARVTSSDTTATSLIALY